MMTHSELIRQRRQIQRRIQEVLAQRRVAAPVAIHPRPPSNPAPSPREP